MIDASMLYGRQLTALACHADPAGLDGLSLVEKRPSARIEGGRLVCLRCGSRTPVREVTLPNGDCYCPHCIMLGRMSVSTTLYSIREPNAFEKCSAAVLTWSGKLSARQQAASDSLVKASEVPGDHLLWAVTGAGKTEMTFATLQNALVRGRRICFSAPRIDVINELFPRLKQAFSSVDIVCLHSRSDARYRYTPLVLCTTHQLMRFYHAFDLMIIDEVDSFPFLGNGMLEYAAENALKEGGTRILLTATPDEKLQKKIRRREIDVIYLPMRFHGHPLPVPRIRRCSGLREKISSGRIPGAVREILTAFYREGHPFLVFVPVIDLLHPVLFSLRRILPDDCVAESVHAADQNRVEKVQAMRDGRYRCLVTTTILERGVTFPKLNVAVLCADAAEFSLPSLVQIAGRAGRSSERPDGRVEFLCDNCTRRVRGAVRQIRDVNRKAVKGSE